MKNFQVHGNATKCENAAPAAKKKVESATKGMANFPDQFTSAASLFGPRFNCAGGAPQVRRVNAGVFEVRFPGNATQVAMASSGAAETTIGYVGNATFRVGLWVPGRQDAIDTTFSVIAG